MIENFRIKSFQFDNSRPQNCFNAKDLVISVRQTHSIIAIFNSNWSWT
jgi:hypothetical protein